jgi:outer membrane protein OmpA-like peptidoglycan-associated protein
MRFQGLKINVTAICAGLILLVGCTTDPFTGEEKMSNTGKGALIGAAGGAALGAISGKTQTALIAAGIGALAGGAVGQYMDRQEDKLRAQLRGTGVSVTRQGDNIHLNMPGNITFATDSDDINSSFYPVLNSVVLVLNEYEQTLIQVAGYTDSTGRAEYNQTLSEKRARSVGDYFVAQQIPVVRVETYGLGQGNPVASNDTPEGRQKNRRVELILVPLTA